MQGPAGRVGLVIESHGRGAPRADGVLSPAQWAHHFFFSSQSAVTQKGKHPIQNTTTRLRLSETPPQKTVTVRRCDVTCVIGHFQKWTRANGKTAMTIYY
jgi:hypothetical protein